jgi:hypothetical protein
MPLASEQRTRSALHVRAEQVRIWTESREESDAIHKYEYGDRIIGWISFFGN